jgi:hypothetical protein
VRYHEASRIEKIKIEIERLQRRGAELKSLGTGKETFADLADEMAELHRRKAELQADAPVNAPEPAHGSPADALESPLAPGPEKSHVRTYDAAVRPRPRLHGARGAR